MSRQQEEFAFASLKTLFTEVSSAVTQLREYCLAVMDDTVIFEDDTWEGMCYELNALLVNLGADLKNLQEVR